MERISKQFSFDDIPDLSGQVVIVTGGATGIGYQTSVALLTHNATVYIASRSKAKFEAMQAEMRGVTAEQKQRLKFLLLDLSSMDACAKAADALMTYEQRLDVLIANAALSIMPCSLTTDGYEIQFATNHLGHYVFISHLLSLIKKTSIEYDQARIVVVASHAHAMFESTSGIDYDNLTVAKENDMTKISDIKPSLQRYARSKLANIQYTRALQRRVETEGFNNIFVNCLNPGTTGSPTFGSDGSPHLPSWVKTLSQGIVWMTSISRENGSLTSLMLATDPQIVSKNVKGRYFDVGPIGGKFMYGYSYDAEEKLSELAKNNEMGEMLMKWSEKASAKAGAGISIIGSQSSA